MKKMKAGELSVTEEPSQTDKEPETADQCFNKGTEEEESGDRWITSDLSKALRFYQRAFDLYQKTLKMNPKNLDALYNASRLLFSVYTEYIKNEAVNLADLTNCEEALSGNDNSVIQPLEKITSVFQHAVDFVGSHKTDSLPWDLYYNAAICYFEYAEDMTSGGYETDAHYDEAIGAMVSSEQLLTAVLKFQMQSLQDTDSGDQKNKEEEDDDDDDDKIVPTTALETCIDGYRLVTTLYEDACTKKRDQDVEKASQNFISDIDAAASELINAFSANGRLEADQINELRLAKAAFSSSRCTDVLACDNVWKQSQIEDRPDKLLIQAGSYRTLLDKYDEANVEISDDQKWTVLTYMDRLYKQAYRILKAELDEYKLRKKKDHGDDSSNIISQICTIFIEEADIALERSNLTSCDIALKSQSVLVKNFHALLKNAVIYSKKSGGLRESIVGKLMREKRRREALIRMCIADGKTSVAELNSIIGFKHWPQEVQDLAEVAQYSEGAAHIVAQL